MLRTTRMPRSQTSKSRVLRGVVLVATTILLTLTSAAIPAQAVPVHPGGPEVTTTTRPATARIFDGDNNFIVFVNKSRADLCTPERLVYEAAFFEWLNTDQQTDPPVEPAASRQGVEPVSFTTRTAGQVTTETIYGPDLPVEVWRVEDNAAAIDCLATDGAGAGLFATGTMTWRLMNRSGPQLVSNELSIKGKVITGSGQRYKYLVDYKFRQVADRDGVFTPNIVLKPIG